MLEVKTTRMRDQFSIQVPKLRGLIFHFVVIMGLMGAIGLMVSRVTRSKIGPQSILFLVASVLLSILLPIFAYRLFALLQSEYSIDRDHVLLRWGLRQVSLPHDLILDSALGEELQQLPQLPRWRWPGSLLGKVKDEDLGEVEYLAAQKEGIVLIGTPGRVYAISPEKPKEFLSLLHREAERGSLNKKVLLSVEPSFVLTQAWIEKDVRRLLFSGAILALTLLIIVGFLVQGRDSIQIGINALGQPNEAVPALQLFLLPAINLVIFMANMLLGLILFREPRGLLLSKLVWGSSIVTGALFMGAILLIL